MMSGYWQILKGLLIVMMIIIIISVLAWLIEQHEDVIITLIMTIVIVVGIFGVIFIAENLYKLFKSWWNGPPPAST